MEQGDLYMEYVEDAGMPLEEYMALESSRWRSGNVAGCQGGLGAGAGPSTGAYRTAADYE